MLRSKGPIADPISKIPAVSSVDESAAPCRAFLAVIITTWLTGMFRSA